MDIDPTNAAGKRVSFDDFVKLDLRAGTVLAAEPLEGARKPALKLRIDFGPGVGVKQSSARITERYEPAVLVGRQVVGVVNFPPRQIGKFMSEVLVLGFADETGAIRLIKPDTAVPNGARLG